MKRCPGCSRNYMEDGLSFCLECGTPLLDAGTVSSTTPGDLPAFDPNATLAFAPPHDTSPPPTQIIDPSQLPQIPPVSQQNRQSTPPAYHSSPGQPPSQQHQSVPPSQHQSASPPPPPTSFVPQQPARPSDPGRFTPSTNPPHQPTMHSSATPPPPPAWNQPQPGAANYGANNYGYAATPSDKPGKSKLPLILGAVALIAVLGIGGVIALFMLSGGETTNANNANNNNSRVANNNVKTPPANTNNVKTDPPSKTYRDDFSTENWETGADAFGSTYKDGEYVMKRNEPGTFIVMYGGRNGNRANFDTPNSTVKVTARSVDGNVPQFGYGLVVQGELIEQGTDKLLNDYSFLIRNGSAGEYSIVKHVRTAQTNLVPWTKSAAIRTGTTPNELEVRIDGNDLTFYINGQRIRGISDTTYADGYAGFYTSTGGAVAFDNLEITKK